MMRDRIRFWALTALAVAAPSLGHAEDLRRDYVWVQAEGSHLKLGLQPRDPDQRSMSYDYVFIDCTRREDVAVSAWPVDRRARPVATETGLTVTTNLGRHVLPNPKRSFNEMDGVWQVTARTSDLGWLRAMLRASRIHLGATGLSLELPTASGDIGAFLRRCERFRR